MVSKVITFIDEYKMIEKDDCVAAGVSGGADSLCLLFMLLEYQKKVPFDLVVVHVNHGIREDAKEDELFVKKICEEKKIAFYGKNTDIKALAKKEHLSIEEAGRKVRYEAFKDALTEYRREHNRQGKIAVAHHQGDSAETMLFHLFRGTGIWGMGGILPVNDNIIRPLLSSSREEIEHYLIKRNQPWCIDFTNEEDTYTRNKIRHHILPYANMEINEKATKHVADAALQMVSLRLYLEEEIKKMAVDVEKSVEKNSICANIEKMQTYPLFLQEQYLLAALNRLLPGRKNITSKHIRAMLDLLKKEGSKKINLPGNLEAVKEYDFLKIKQRVQEEPQKSKEILLQEAGNICLPDNSILEISFMEGNQLERIEENKYTKYFDYDKIKYCLKMRYRQTGDYLTINDQGQKKSLKEYFIQEKIPASLRNNVWLIADDNHILWVIGYRISAYYKVTSETKNVVKITIRRDENVRKN